MTTLHPHSGIIAATALAASIAWIAGGPDDQHPSGKAS